MRDELSLTPSPEITVLAEQARGVAFAPAVLTVLPPIQTTNDAPRWANTLVGREAEWEQLEAAYAKGLLIYIAGPPGIGKTRLMQEFTASKGGVWVEFKALPSDVGIPYSSYARSVRVYLARFPDIKLESWMSAELKRILPDLWPEIAPAQHPSAQEGKLRLFHAIAGVFVAATPYMSGGMMADDIQFFDQASAEASLYQVSTWQRFGGEGANTPHVITTFRTGEMPPGVEEGIRAQAAAGHAVLVELKPLSSRASLQLILQAMPDIDTPLAQKLHQFTGGNPFFALETLQALPQSSGALPVAGSVLELIQSRLDQLSHPARNLARLAAVAGADFSLELASSVFEQNHLLQAVEELQIQHFFKDAAFAHDLLYEATLKATPKAMRQLLHGSLLRAMPSAQASVRLRHALGAENPTAVLQHSLEAAQEALELSAEDEIFRLLEQAIGFFEERQMEMQASRVRGALEQIRMQPI